MKLQQQRRSSRLFKNIAGKGDSICNKRLYTFPIENKSSVLLHMKQYSTVYRKASSFSVLEDRSAKQGPYSPTALGKVLILVLLQSERFESNITSDWLSNMV